MAAPTTPSLLFPADAAANVAVSADLIWGAQVDADSFSIKLDTSPSPGLVATQVGNLYNPPTDLLPSTTYYWQVVATNGDGSTNSPIYSFTTTNSTATPPASPSSPTPGVAQVDVSIDVTLGWAYDVNTTTYDVAFGTSPTPSTVASGLTASEYTPATLTAFTTYYWQVTANGPGGISFGPVWSFTTGADDPTGGLTAPSNPSPADRQNYVTSNPTLTWDGDSGPTFDVYFGTVLPPPLVASNLAAKTYTPTGPLANGTYYWRVEESRGDVVTSSDGEPLVTSDGDTLVTTGSSNLASSPVWRFFVGTYATPHHSKQWSLHQFMIKPRSEERS